MLSKISQTLRSLVNGDSDQSIRRPSKRSRSSLDDSDDEDFVEAPAKKGRFTQQQYKAKNTTNSITTNWSFGKVAEFFVRGKQTIGENSFVRSIATTASPKRLFRKISSLTASTDQGSEMSKQYEASGHSYGAPPLPYSATGREMFASGGERPAPRVGYVDMPQFYMAPPAPMQQVYDGGYKVTFNKAGMDQRQMQQQQQQHPRYSSTPRYNGGHIPRQYRSMYDKTYGSAASGKGAWSVNRSVSTSESNSAKSKLAAKESIRLEEKNRYAQLLQQFTTAPLTGPTMAGPFTRKPRQQHSVNETVLGSKIERSISHDSALSGSSSETPVVHVEPNKVVPKPLPTTEASPGLSHKSFVELKSLRQTGKHDKSHTSSKDQNGSRKENGYPEWDVSSTRSRYDEFTPFHDRQQVSREQFKTPAQPKFDADDKESPPLEIVKVEGPVRLPVRSPSSEMFEAALKDSPYLDDHWIKDLHSKYSTDHRNRKIVEQEVAVEYMKEKRESLDEFLQSRLKKRLSLHEKAPAVLKEDFDDEEDKADEFPELTEEMESMIDDALRPYPAGEVVSEEFRLQITRKDMETLAGLNWLNDEVINFYMELLKERGTLDNFPKVHSFNTFFYPKIMSGGHAAVKRWTRRVDVFSVDYIIVPVHLGMHWCLAVMDFPKKQIRYYDSMGGANKQCLQGLKDYLQAESMDKKKQTFDMSDWTLERATGIPHQMNGSDCGVFACKFAEYISRGAEITFTQEHMPYFRRRMVYEILTKKLL